MPRIADYRTLAVGKFTVPPKKTFDFKMPEGFHKESRTILSYMLHVKANTSVHYQIHLNELHIVADYFLNDVVFSGTRHEVVPANWFNSLPNGNRLDFVKQGGDDLEFADVYILCQVDI